MSFFAVAACEARASEEAGLRPPKAADCAALGAAGCRQKLFFSISSSPPPPFRAAKRVCVQTRNSFFGIFACKSFFFATFIRKSGSKLLHPTHERVSLRANSNSFLLYLLSANFFFATFIRKSGSKLPRPTHAARAETACRLCRARRRKLQVLRISSGSVARFRATDAFAVL